MNEPEHIVDAEVGLAGCRGTPTLVLNWVPDDYVGMVMTSESITGEPVDNSMSTGHWHAGSNCDICR